MSRGYFVPYNAWTKIALRKPEVRALVYETAKVTQQNVLEAIPVHYGTGQEIFESTSKVQRRTSQGVASARVTTGDSLWHLLEFGSVNNPPYRPFQTGVEATGLEWHGN